MGEGDFAGTESYRERAKEYQRLYDQGHKFTSSYARHASDIIDLCDRIEDLQKQNEQAWERAALEARRVLKNGRKALKLERKAAEQDKEIERLESENEAHHDLLVDAIRALDFTLTESSEEEEGR